MALTTEQLERLPKWAQNYITDLERRFTAADDALTAISGDDKGKGSRIWVETRSGQKIPPFADLRTCRPGA